MGILDAPVIPVESFGTKLRRLARQAAERDPYVLPSWVTAAPWQASTAYTPGIVVSNSNNYYICIQSGTSAASGGPTAVNGRTITDGTALWCLYGPVTAATNDNRAPAYTGSTTSPGLPNVYNAALDPGAFRMYGGYPTVYATNYWYLNRFNTKSGTVALGDGRVAFYTDAPKFSILGGATAQMRVRIDGRFYSPSAVNYISSGTGFHTFDFAGVGGRRARFIEVELNRSSHQFYGVAVAQGDSVWAPAPVDDVRAVWISDSIMAGSAFGPFAQSVPQVAGTKLGWTDNWNMSMGGTGWLNPGTSSYYTFRQRLPEALTRNPDVWVLTGSTNDATYTATAITNEVTGALQDIRAGGSRAPIIMLGCWSIDIASGLNAAQIEAAVEAGVTAANDPLGKTFFIPVRGDSFPWITTTSNNAGHTAATNFSQLLGNDNVHPSENGTMYYADRIALAVKGKVLPYLR